jgi:hypothetical protein
MLLLLLLAITKLKYTTSVSRQWHGYLLSSIEIIPTFKKKNLGGGEAWSRLNPFGTGTPNVPLPVDR